MAEMNEYITKPLNEKELNRIITRILDLSPGDSTLKKDIPSVDENIYHFINLKYMRDISGGDKQYEKKSDRTVFRSYIG